MIELRDVAFTPAGSDRPILSGVNLAIAPGERVGIVGPSGSGKSTLGYHLCGAHRLALAGATTGGVLLDGRDCLAGGPPGFAGLVGQNPEAQLFCRTVREEVLLGPRMRGDTEARCKQVAGELLDRHGLGWRAEDVVTKLSLGQKQLTAILSMLAIEPKVLLLDEPTSYLDEATASRIFAHLDELSRKRGWIVLVIEHDLDRLSGFADRFLELAGGQVVSDGPMRRRPRPTLPPLGPIRPAEANTPPLLSLSGVSFAYGKGKSVLEEVDLAVRPGECVALVGPNGSGKSTLLRLVKRLLKPRTGRVELAEGVTASRDVGLMLQNPEEQIFAHTVEAECGYWLANLGVAPEARAAAVRAVLDELGLGAMLDRSPFSLSFGEKRRLCLGAVLVAEPRILCLDEPTTGLDDANMAAMAAMVRRLTAEGRAVLVATHEEAFAAMTATRRVRLEAGRVVSDACCPGEAA